MLNGWRRQGKSLKLRYLRQPVATWLAAMTKCKGSSNPAPECCNADVHPPHVRPSPNQTQCRLAFEIIEANWFQKENWLRKRIETLKPSSSSAAQGLTSLGTLTRITHRFFRRGLIFGMVTAPANELDAATPPAAVKLRNVRRFIGIFTGATVASIDRPR